MEDKTKPDLWDLHCAILSIYKLTSQGLNGDFLFFKFLSGGSYTSLSKLNYELYVCEVYYSLLGIYMTQLISPGLSTRLETRSGFLFSKFVPFFHPSKHISKVKYYVIHNF